MCLSISAAPTTYLGMKFFEFTGILPDEFFDKAISSMMLLVFAATVVAIYIEVRLLLWCIRNKKTADRKKFRSTLLYIISLPVLIFLGIATLAAYIMSSKLCA